MELSPGSAGVIETSTPRIQGRWLPLIVRAIGRQTHNPLIPLDRARLRLRSRTRQSVVTSSGSLEFFTPAKGDAMSYVDSSLLNGETVTYRGRMSPTFLFAWPFLIAFAALFMGGGSAAAFTLALAIVLAGLQYIRLATSEFAVTNKRVIIKVGLIRLHTLEMLLSKVESIAVDQGILGRLGNWGTLTVVGSGATKEYFPGIDAPLEFRRAVQAQST